MGRSCSFNMKSCSASLLIKETKVETAIPVISYRSACRTKKDQKKNSLIYCLYGCEEGGGASLVVQR